MKLHLVQRDATVGDLAGNAAGLVEAARCGRLEGAWLVVAPELALVGYPPQDLLDEPDFVAAALSARERLVEQLGRAAPGVGVVFGAVGLSPHPTGKRLQNVAVVARDGREIAVRAKSLLPTYDIFDEARWFAPARKPTPVVIDGVSIALTTCEDAWNDAAWFRRPGHDRDPVAELAAQGAELILNLSASPYHRGKARGRAAMMAASARRHGLPFAFVNQVGAHDELIFDGDSLLLDGEGRVVARAQRFTEDRLSVELARTADGRLQATAAEPPPPEPEDGVQDLRRALVLGLASYVRRCRFDGVLVGLSGGVDSAVVACLAAEALGPGAVEAVLMPSRFTAERSNSDALELARRLGIATRSLPIEAIHCAFLDALAPELPGAEAGVTGENIQARARGTLLMALSNATGRLVLATGNKSELATGYCTLYGDMVGGLGVIGDCTKTWVRALAASYAAGDGPLPHSIVERAPTAELRPDQLDEDSLPPYEQLDRVLEALVEQRATSDEVRELGLPVAVVDRTRQLLAAAEHKRRQAAPVLRVTARAFGPGRRLPLARGDWRAPGPGSGSAGGT